MSISNGIGTHIGYCISMNKPHYIFSQPKDLIIRSGVISEYDDDLYVSKSHKEEVMFERIFNSKEPKITDEQREIINFYFGSTVG
jgi:hypothetical protein